MSKREGIIVNSPSESGDWYVARRVVVVVIQALACCAYEDEEGDDEEESVQPANCKQH